MSPLGDFLQQSWAAALRDGWVDCGIQHVPVAGFAGPAFSVSLISLHPQLPNPLKPGHALQAACSGLPPRSPCSFP